MAVDTANKRGSALGVGMASPRVFPVPDGSLGSKANREQMGYSYALDAEIVRIVVSGWRLFVVRP